MTEFHSSQFGHQFDFQWPFFCLLEINVGALLLVFKQKDMYESKKIPILQCQNTYIILFGRVIVL